jgi:hypothetical protein
MRVLECRGELCDDSQLAHSGADPGLTGIALHGRRVSFVPPYGEHKVVSRFNLVTGLKRLSMESRDWWDHDGIADLLVSRIRSGSIVILHHALRQHRSTVRRPIVIRRPHVDQEAMLKVVTFFLERTASPLSLHDDVRVARHGYPRGQFA